MPKSLETLPTAITSVSYGISRTGVIGSPLVVELGVELHHPARAVEPDHLAVAEPEAVPVGLGEIVELVPRHVHAAGGNFVQQRLPQMGARLVDERDLGAVAAPELIAEASDELEPAGAAADHDDTVERSGWFGRNGRLAGGRDRHAPAPSGRGQGLRLRASQYRSRLSMSAGLK